MNAKLLLAACIFAAAANAFAQSGEPGNDGNETRNITNKTEAVAGQASSTQPSVTAEVERSSRPPTSAETAAKDKDPIDTGYERPDAKQRFRNYLKNLGSPLALGYYAGTAGLLTFRNSPKEWGDHGDGYARRFANVAGKHAIRTTTIYALDEALKLDSSFYRSKDRSLTARLRNCVFSAVTARDRRGKRVLGIPVIAGGVLSEVVSSSGWYPRRYDYEHGLKGGAISIGVTAGLNLFKEFVWNP